MHCITAKVSGRKNNITINIATIGCNIIGYPSNEFFSKKKNFCQKYLNPWSFISSSLYKYTMTDICNATIATPPRRGVRHADIIICPPFNEFNNTEKPYY